MIVLAWLFVLTRIVHAAIHIGPNKVRWRSPAFALGLPDRRRHVDQAARCTWRRPGWPEAMRPGAHIKAAVEVLEEVLEQAPPGGDGAGRLGQEPPLRRLRRPRGHRQPRLRRPAPPPLARRADGQRHARAPSRWPPPRARSGCRAAAVIASADGSPHALEPLSEAEQAAPVARAAGRRAGRRCAATIPDWLEPSFARAFGAAAAEEGAALARRAPVDLRVNTLKADREQGAEGAGALCSAEPTPLLAGRRAPAGARRAGPPAQRRGRDRARRGWYEVQDEGSQIAALMAGAGPAPAGARYLCRRRRQDAGLGRGHAQHRPDLRLRRRRRCACGRSSSG